MSLLKKLPRAPRLATLLTFFASDGRSVGLVLLACAAVSMVLANLPIGTSYHNLLNAPFSALRLLHLPHTPLLIINDGFMAVFFFLVALEIKRELTTGELNSTKKALLPAAAALGGMLVPAGLFLVFNAGTPFQAGWGIPMATDIAFSLGAASLLGKRFPMALRVFLTALAIIDDLGAIVVIAIFYGHAISFWYLLLAGGCLALLVGLNKWVKRFGLWHVLVGLVLWYAVFCSGVHATVAGVLLALTVPMGQIVWLERRLYRWANYVVLPLFALANTALVLEWPQRADGVDGLYTGILLGLFVGKPVGIFITARLMVLAKWAVLPTGINWRHMWGAGMLAGIGFTMGIFMANLAFTTVAYQNASKLAILLASLLAAVLGYGWLKWQVGSKHRPHADTD
jgi:NhaA family Na+:H+ antiporter